jgi:hypothetical protein
VSTPSPYEFTVLFSSPQLAAAFALVTTGPGTLNFTAMLGAATVETASVPTNFNIPNNFFGFQNITFDRILVNYASSGAPLDSSMVLDNVQLSPVPEPSSIVLGSLAGLGLFAQAWRRRQQRTAAQ